MDVQFLMLQELELTFEDGDGYPKQKANEASTNYLMVYCCVVTINKLWLCLLIGGDGAIPHQ